MSRSLKQLINRKDSPFSQLLEKAHRHEKLDQALASFLPSPLSKHCKVANLREDVLVLSVTSAAWSARLRFMTPAILNYLRDKCSLAELKSIRIRISLPEAGRKPRNRLARSISEASATGLKDCAETLQDESLRIAMRKLASRAGD